MPTFSLAGPRLALLVFLFAGCASTAPAPPALASQPASALPTIEAKTAGMERHGGFLPSVWDAAAGKVWLEVPALNTDLLYVNSLAAGLGPNNVGLDRGQFGTLPFERSSHGFSSDAVARLARG